MLISYRYKFIFIHNYKAAGSSVNLALRKFALKDPLYYNIFNRPLESFYLGRFITGCLSKLSFLPTFKGHDTAQTIESKLPINIWSSFFKFGFARNPWDWQVSLYHFMLKEKYHPQHELIINLKSFDQYIEWRVEKDKHLQKEFFFDNNDQQIVDYIGKFENIEDDFRNICKKIGINTDLPHKNKSMHRDYHEYYSDYSRDLIGENFKQDIELFNYTF